MQDSLLFHHFELMSYETCVRILNSASPKESIMITMTITDTNLTVSSSTSILCLCLCMCSFILQPLLAGSEQTVAGRAAGVLLSADSRAHFRPSSGSVDSRFDLLPLAGAPKDGADRDEELVVLGQAGDCILFTHIKYLAKYVTMKDGARPSRKVNERFLFTGNIKSAA